MITITRENNMELMARYPDNYFDLAIVDPPYGILNKTKRGGDHKFNMDEYSQWDVKPDDEYFNELFRVSKNQIIWGANYFCEFLPSGTGWLFWNKLNGLDNCFSDGEFAFSSKGVQSKYFECSTFHDLKGGKDRIHPTQKPTKLYKWLLKNYAKQGDKILDTHLGSGSIAIACHDYKFELTACELDPEYFEKAKQRIINHVAQQSLF